METPPLSYEDMTAQMVRAGEVEALVKRFDDPNDPYAGEHEEGKGRE